MSTTPHSPLRTAMFPDDQSAGPETVDVHPLDPDNGDSAHIRYETTAQAGRGEFNSYDGQGMPPLSEYSLTDTHSCARLLSTFADRLVVADTPGAHAEPLLYVVDPTTGLVSSTRGQILSMSMQVADDSLADYDDLMGAGHPAEGESPTLDDLPPLPSKTAIINHARGCARSGRRRGIRRQSAVCWSTTGGREAP